MDKVDIFYKTIKEFLDKNFLNCIDNYNDFTYYQSSGYRKALYDVCDFVEKEYGKMIEDDEDDV